MSSTALQTLSDIASEAHTQVQQSDTGINPVIGLRRGMRETGIPADAMTIDCLRTRRRILLVLHDRQPDALLFQFAGIDDEDDPALSRMALAELDSDRLVTWMRNWFADGKIPPAS